MMIEFGMPFVSAIAYAADAHNGQARKGRDIPYLCHPLAVASLVIEYGGDEEMAIAALLHDVIEDCDPVYAERMQEHFGSRVLALVRTLTDGTPGPDGQKPEWRARKEAHLARLRDANPDVLLIAACDKIHNARCLLEDIKRDGPDATMQRFTGGADGTSWYYREMAKLTASTPAGPALAELATALSVWLSDTLPENEGADLD